LDGLGPILFLLYTADLLTYEIIGRRLENLTLHAASSAAVAVFYSGAVLLQSLSTVDAREYTRCKKILGQLGAASALNTPKMRFQVSP